MASGIDRQGIRWGEIAPVYMYQTILWSPMNEDTKTLATAYGIVLIVLTVAMVMESAGLLLFAFAIAIISGLWYGRKKGIEHKRKHSA